jgi:hypothetical protein
MAFLPPERVAELQETLRAYTRLVSGGPLVEMQESIKEAIRVATAAKPIGEMQETLRAYSRLVRGAPIAELQEVMRANIDLISAPMAEMQETMKLYHDAIGAGPVAEALAANRELLNTLIRSARVVPDAVLGEIVDPTDWAAWVRSLPPWAAYTLLSAMLGLLYTLLLQMDSASAINVPNGLVDGTGLAAAVVQVYAAILVIRRELPRD